MSSQRYTPEFKDEAVRQVVDRGYSAPETSRMVSAFEHTDLEQALSPGRPARPISGPRL